MNLGDYRPFLEPYDLGEIQDWRTDGEDDKVLHFIATDKGAFVQKAYRTESWDLPGLEFQASLLDFLKERLEVSELIKCRNGELVAMAEAESATYYLITCELLAGETPKNDDGRIEDSETLKLMGSYLGRFHSARSSWTSPNRQPSPFLRWESDNRK